MVLDEELHESTIGGHLLEELGRMPDAGEIVHLHGVPLEIAGVGEARITELRVQQSDLDARAAAADDDNGR
jgi:CBS domain containing-hemolysin-like protein